MLWNPEFLFEALRAYHGATLQSVDLTGRLPMDPDDGYALFLTQLDLDLAQRHRSLFGSKERDI